MEELGAAGLRIKAEMESVTPEFETMILDLLDFVFRRPRVSQLCDRDQIGLLSPLL